MPTTVVYIHIELERLLKQYMLKHKISSKSDAIIKLIEEGVKKDGN